MAPCGLEGRRICPATSVAGDECARVITGADNEPADDRERSGALAKGEWLRGRRGSEDTALLGEGELGEAGSVERRIYGSRASPSTDGGFEVAFVSSIAVGAMMDGGSPHRGAIEGEESVRASEVETDGAATG